jgi:PAS domain S-box-containing protein
LRLRELAHPFAFLPTVLLRSTSLTESPDIRDNEDAQPHAQGSVVPKGLPVTLMGRVQQVLMLAGLCAAYIFASQFARLVSLQDGMLTPYSPAAGIGLWALLILGRRGLLVVLLGEWMLHFTVSTPPSMILLLASGEALGLLAAWELLTAGGRRAFHLSRSSDLGRLVVSGLICGALPAITGLLGDCIASGTTGESLFIRWCVWTVGNLLGAVSVVSLLYAWSRPARTAFTTERWLETVALGVVTLASSLLTFLRGGEGGILGQPLAFPTFTVQVWAALRFGLRGTAVVSMFVSLVAVYGTSTDRGPFAYYTGLNQALVLQGYILLHVLIGLMLAILLYERQRAEAELRRQREYLRQIVDISPDIIFVKDRHHRYVFVNQAMANLYGTTIRDLLGRTDRDFSRNPELAEFYARADEEVLRTGTESFVPEEPLVDHHGNVRWVQVVKRALRDEHGIPRQVLGVATDITARRNAERALEEQRNYLRQILDVNPSLIFVKDLEGRFVLVNQAVADMFGVSVEQIIGKTDADFNPNADEVEFFRQMDMEVISSGEDLFIPEEVLTDSQGNRHWLQTIKRPLFDRNGLPVEVLGVATDITVRKLAEEHRTQLEQRMQQSQRLESMGIMAGGVAHDFNNLLAAILGNADLALLDMDPSSPATASVRRIRTTALRASELASQMLAYSGSGSVKRNRIQLNELLDDMFSLMQAALPKGASLLKDFHTSLPDVEGDPEQLRQVAMNLVTNAADALSQGVGLISVKTDTAEIGGVQMVLLEVRDNGVGMDNETLARVFDPFFTTKFTGRGLGMAAVLGIIRGHGGTIELESTPGAGTCVRVMLPTAEGVEVTAPRADTVSESTQLLPIQADTAALDLAPLILIVDDDPAVCSVARRALTRSGFKTIEANNGGRALEIFMERKGEIAAVLLDLTMPELSGDEVLERMRHLDSGVPVIISSGYSEADVTARIGRHGCAGFLQKPYEVVQLVTTFSQLTGWQPVQSKE